MCNETTPMPLDTRNSSLPANPKFETDAVRRTDSFDDKGNLHASVPVKSLTNRPVHGRFAADQDSVPGGRKYCLRSLILFDTFGSTPVIL